MDNTIKVILVEDHPDYRMSIELALAKEPDIELINQYGTAEQALQNIGGNADSDIPELLLLDLNLPRMNGTQAIPEFLAIAPALKIIVLTQSDKEADVLEAIRAGASGYLLKSSTRRAIADAIREVSSGQASLDPKIAQFIISNLRLSPSGKADHTTDLTERELEVLTLLGEGLVQKEISDRLSISAHTVGNHIRHIYEKLQVPNAPAAITEAYRSGILPSTRKR